MYPLNASMARTRRFAGSLFDTSAEILVLFTHLCLNICHKDLPVDMPNKMSTIIPKTIKSSVKNTF